MQEVQEPSFAFQVTYFVEETISHIFIVIPLQIATFLLVIFDLTSKERQTSKLDEVLLTIAGVFFGILQMISFAEAGGMLIFSLLVNALLLYVFYSRSAKANGWKSLPAFSRYWVISSVVTLVLGILYGFVKSS